MPLLRFFKLDATGQPTVTAEGFAAANLVKQLNVAYINNTDYVLGWFKGLNVKPSNDNCLEFSDELQEYINYNAKKSTWDNSFATGDYFKWDYYAQESRPVSGINIVDQAFIDDRAYQVKLSEQSGNQDFIEYYGRFLPNTFDVVDVFAPDPVPTALNSMSTDYVLAWFKGVNLAPTNAALSKYKVYIKNYLLDSRTSPDIKVDIGIFISK
jgi:hypothetical protein